MKFKTFFSIISFALITNCWAKLDPKTLYLHWGKAELVHSPFHSEITTSTEDNYMLIQPIKGMKLNLKRENFYFQFRLGSFQNFVGMEIRFSEKRGYKNYYSYSLPYFSDAEFNPYKENEWLNYGISLANLKLVGKEPDKINNVSFFLFTNKKTLKFGLKKIWKKKKPKEGVVSITFDDGYDSQLVAAKLTNKFRLKATAYIMPRDIGKFNLMDLQQLKQMKGWGWDLQSHHSYPLTIMNESERKIEFNFGLNFLNKHRLASKTQHLAYPLGKHNERLIRQVKKYFKTARIAGGGIETLPPADLYRIRTYNVMANTTLKELKEKILDAKNQGQWLILMFHYMKKDAKKDLEYSPENFRLMAEFLKQKKIKVLTIDEAYREYLK